MGNILSCFMSQNYAHMYTDFEAIKEQNKAEFTRYISYRANRTKLHTLMTDLHQNYLIFFSLNNKDLLGWILASNKFSVTGKDVLHIDHNNMNILFHLVTNQNMSLDTLNQIIETKSFVSNIDAIFAHTNERKENFIAHALESEHLNEAVLKEMIKIAPVKVVENTYANDATYCSVLSYFILNSHPLLANIWIEKISKLDNLNEYSTTPYRYMDIVHMAMTHSEDCLISLIKNKLHEKLKINIKNKVYLTHESQQFTVFEFACANSMKNYIKLALTKKLYTDNCIQKNIFSLVPLVPSDKILFCIEKGLFPHSVLSIGDRDGNTLFGYSIIHGKSLHRQLFEKGQITTSVLKAINKLGDNCIILAARHDREFLPFLYEYVKPYPEVLFARNYQGSDFIDILTYELNTDCLYYLNFFDDVMYDTKQNILYKFTNGELLTIDEYAFLRYQYNSTVPESYVDKVDEDLVCIICMAEVMRVQFNCKHSICFKCSLMVRNCPLCRTIINKKTLLVDV